MLPLLIILGLVILWIGLRAWDAGETAEAATPPVVLAGDDGGGDGPDGGGVLADALEFLAGLLG